MKKSDLIRILGILDLVVVCACVGNIPVLVSSVLSQPLLVGGVVMTAVLVAISGYTHLTLSAKAPIWYYSSLPLRVLRVFLGQLTFMFLLWTFPEARSHPKTSSDCDWLQRSWIGVVGEKGSRRTSVRLRAFFTSALTTNVSLNLVTKQVLG